VAGLAIGTFALFLAQKLWILTVAIVPVALGLWYNFGRHPLAYSRWGETVTGFCYGVGVFGCLWLLRPASPQTLVFGIIGCGSLAMAMLLAHQPSQVLTDAAAGKQTFAVVYGAAKTRRRARLLFLLTVGAFVATLGGSL